jgi:predicted RNA-binding protein with TRAM domain
MELLILAAAAGGAIGLGGTYAVMRWRSSGKRASKRAHEAAQEREPPVELGSTYEFGVTDFSDHHSGERVAVGKVEGFVLFVEDIPGDLSNGDVIRAKVLSFNEGRTSADATFVESV